MRKHIHYKWWWVGLGYLWIMTAGHKAWGESFQDAAQAYDQGHFQEAVRIYEALAQKTPRGEVFYNLGNAYIRLQQYGHGVAAYLAARDLSPRDPDVSANLRFALARTEDRWEAIDEPSFIDILWFWRLWFSTQEAFWISLGLWTMGWLVWWSRWLGRHPHNRQNAGLLCLSIGLCMAGLGVAGPSLWSYGVQYKPWGAVVPSEAVVRSGPGEHNQPLFKIHAGAPVRVIQRTPGWCLVHLFDGHDTKKGWLPASHIKAYNILWHLSPIESLENG